MIEHPQTLRLGTRASALAQWQADWVAGRLRDQGVEVVLVLLTTQGDASPRPLGAIGGRGVFTKEIQRALLDGEVDLAVHSLKDLPTDPAPGLTLAAVPERESPHDVLVCRVGGSLETLPAGARVGTGSTRRRAQLLHVRPDLDLQDIRGNVDTRLRKLDEGQYDAVVLAEAGLRRLGWCDRISHVLSFDVMLPAAGQGALGIEARSDDPRTLAFLEPLNDAASRAAVLAERALLRGLHAGCLAPVGAWARVGDRQLVMDAAVLSPDGRQRVAAKAGGGLGAAEQLGQQLAGNLLAQGAGALIQAGRGEG